jgi:alpha-L-fucosidase
MKKIFLIFFVICSTAVFAQKNNIVPISSKVPNAAQKKMIARKYGMFIHFGINTFLDQEWTDGSIAASSYNPTMIDAEQWVKTAKTAGMKYVILITKHHDGFCMWDSEYTEYDVANSGNKTNVVEAVAKACKKYNMGLGLYYSLWDRNKNADTKDSALDAKYNQYMINQLNELITITKKHTNIVEFWFDGGWEKPNFRWPTQDIYNTIKSREPDCQVGINWTIGLPENPDYHLVLPKDQKTGYPIRYFPSDFRLGDPYLPKENDPKIFTHEGKDYYLPWESTVCMSKSWFFNTTDKTYKSVDELYDLYKKATAQDNVLILNSPPNTDGKMREKDIELLQALKKKINEE